MKKQGTGLYIFVLAALNMNLAAQDPQPMEGNSARQDQINNRWIESQPVIQVLLLSGVYCMFYAN